MDSCILDRSKHKNLGVLKLITLTLALVGQCMLVQTSTEESSIIRTDMTVGDRLPRALRANIPEFFRPYLLLLGPGARKIFVSQCLARGALCEKTTKPWMKWKHPGRMRKPEKARFWKAYECVALMKLDLCPVDGGWGDWSSWSQCEVGTSTCDTIQDTRTRTRSCVSPRPQRLGHPCNGPPSEIKPCPKVCTREDKEMTPAMLKSWKYMVGVMSKYPALRKLCGNRHCVYDDLTPVLTDKVLARYWSALSCYRYGSACPEDGGWSVWKKWSACSARCGKGRRYRTHTCDSPRPAHGGATCKGRLYQRKKCRARRCKGRPGTWARWGRWARCSAKCGGGMTTRRRRCRKGQCRGQRSQTKLCNKKPCTAEGGWSQWAAWTTCSGSCDWGVRMRDRTCSEPTPKGDGATCPGPGSEVAHCFHKPCLVPKAGMEFKGQGRVSYDPSGRPQRALVVSVRFMPSSALGVIVHRVDQPCPEKGCDVSVTLSLDAAHPVLEVTGIKTKVNVKVKSSKAVELEKWHSVVAVVLYNSAHLTVDDDITDRAKFTPHPGLFNYDQSMLLGGSTDDKAIGFKGVIGGIYVNFRPLSLTEDAAWRGYGAPASTEGATPVPLEAVALHPSFNGHQYTWFPCPPDVTSMRAQLVLQLDVTSGLLLFMEGEVTESFLLVGVKAGRVKACASLGGAPACTDNGELKSWEWHHVEVTVMDKVLSLVVDGGQSSTVPLPPPPGPKAASAQDKKTSSRSTPCERRVYIGGVPKSLHALPGKLAGVKGGVKGVVHSVRLNDEKKSLREEPLIVAGEELTGLALLKADHVSVLTSGPADLLVLRCSHRHKTGVVAWLHDNRILHPDTHIHIELQVAGEEPESVVKLRSESGKRAREGVYLCLVTERTGHRHLSHAFLVVPRAETAAFSLGKIVITPDEEETAVVVVAVVAVMSILLVMGMLFAAAKYSRSDSFKELWDKVAPQLPFKLMVRKTDGTIIPITNARGTLVDDPTEGIGAGDLTSSKYALRGSTVPKPSESLLQGTEKPLSNLEEKGDSSSNKRGTDFDQNDEDRMQTSDNSNTSLIVTFDEEPLTNYVSTAVSESEAMTEGTTALSSDSSSDSSSSDNPSERKALLALDGIREESRASITQWQKLSVEAMDFQQHKLEDEQKQSGETLQPVTSKRTLVELSDVGLAEPSYLKLPQSSNVKLSDMILAERSNPSVARLSNQHLAGRSNLTMVNRSNPSSVAGSSNQHLAERPNLTMGNRSNPSVAGSSNQHLAKRSNLTMINRSNSSVAGSSNQSLADRSNLTTVIRSNSSVAGSSTQHLGERSNLIMVEMSNSSVAEPSNQYVVDRSNLTMVKQSNPGVAGSSNQYLVDRSKLIMVDQSNTSVGKTSNRYFAEASHLAMGERSYPSVVQTSWTNPTLPQSSSSKFPQPSNPNDRSNLTLAERSVPSTVGSVNQQLVDRSDLTLVERSNQSVTEPSNQHLPEKSNLTMAERSSHLSVAGLSNQYLAERLNPNMALNSNQYLPEPSSPSLGQTSHQYMSGSSNFPVVETSHPSVAESPNQQQVDKSNLTPLERSNLSFVNSSNQYLIDRSNLTLAERSNRSVTEPSNQHLAENINLTMVERSHPSVAGLSNQYLTERSNPNMAFNSNQYLPEPSSPSLGQTSHQYMSGSSNFSVVETSHPSVAESSNQQLFDKSNLTLLERSNPRFVNSSNQYLIDRSNLTLAERSNRSVTEPSNQHMAEKSNVTMVERSHPSVAGLSNQYLTERSNPSMALNSNQYLPEPSSPSLGQTSHQHMSGSSNFPVIETSHPSVAESPNQQLVHKSNLIVAERSNRSVTEPSNLTEGSSSTLPEGPLVQSPSLNPTESSSLNLAEVMTGEGHPISQHASELWPLPPAETWQGCASGSAIRAPGEQGLLPVPNQYQSQSRLQPEHVENQQAAALPTTPIHGSSESLVDRLKRVLYARHLSPEQSTPGEPLVDVSEPVVTNTETPVNTSNRPSLEAIAFGSEPQEEVSTQGSSGWETESE